MTSFRYDRLTAQDNTFLLAETATAHMHISGVMLFELGDLATADGGVDFPRLRASVEGVLHRIPRYRQKLQWTPITQNPVWVDDSHFNLDYHVRHTSLPKPGNMDQLRKLASRIMAQQLDRDRPLWETWIVEGVSGDRFAMISKVHHCMIDGVSGVDLAQILMSIEPVKEIPEPVAFIPRPAPMGLDLLRDEVLRRASLPGRIASSLVARRDDEGFGDELRVRWKALSQLVSAAARPPSKTPINGELGPHRRFDWLTMSLDDVKAVRRAAECTVNDVVLNTAAGAFREYLQKRGAEIEGLEFRASAPVSVRRDDESGNMGNRVSSWIVPLPIDEPDPLVRLRRIHETTEELKESRQALGVEMMMQVAEWTPPVLLSLGAQSASGQVNTIITNVPGPQFPLYMQGARLRRMIPMPPLLPDMGLAIALFSYDGQLSWGFIADYNLVPDLGVFAEEVARSFAEFAAALGVDVQPAIRDDA